MFKNMLSDSVIVSGMLVTTAGILALAGMRVWLATHQIDKMQHQYNSLRIELAKLKHQVRGEVVEKVSPISDILDELGIDISSPFVRGMIQSLVKKSGILDKLQGKDTSIDEKNIYFED